MADMDWTVLIYMAADNNLDKNGVTDLKKLKSAMIKAGGSNRVSVLVQYDRRGDKKVRRFEITGNGSPNDYLEDTAETIAEVDTGDPAALIDFLSWGIKRRRARHYLVSLWGHGFGVDDETIFESDSINPLPRRLVRPPLFNRAVNTKMDELRDVMSAEKWLSNIERSHPLIAEIGGHDLFKEVIEIATAIGSDDQSKNFLSNVEMKKAFERVRNDSVLNLSKNLDIVMMDACNMAMVEVGYQLRESVDIMVASEETTPIRGWPYDKVLGNLLAAPNISPNSLSGLMVREYIKSYQFQEEEVTQAASNLAKCDAMKDAVDELARVLMSNMLKPGFLDDLRISRYHVQKFYVDGSFVDLYDFCHLLSKRTGVSEVVKACETVKEVISEQDFIIDSGYKGPSVRFSHGISIYFPTDSVAKLYGTMDFVKETRWRKFLETYMKKIERSN